ncbi:MAG: AsmA family protein [Methylobacterium mesophilicum]|nr:AsmA family protein [Methylobacterium mesophilicum]
MLARLFVIFGGLFVLALLAALVMPYVITWNNYRADFEREASAILGRQVTVRGDASARLLPFPSVTFSDVSVAGGPDGEPAMTVDSFSMDAELAPFMSGEFRIFDMRIVRPRANVELAEDGSLDWALRPSSPFDPNRTSLEKLTVTDGEIVLRDRAGDRTHRLSAIDAALSARSLAGPWRLDGTLEVDGMATAVTVSTGNAREGAMPLKLTATPAPLGVTLTTDGTARLTGGKPDYSGSFRMSRAVAVPVAGEDEPANEAAPAEPGFRLNGQFALDHEKLAVDQFRFETGSLDQPYTADGSAQVAFGRDPRFTIEANGAQVRLDEPAEDGAPQPAALGLDQRLQAFENWVDALPRPNIPGTVDLNLPAIVAGDTTIREVRLSAEPVEGGWRIGSLAATLPGRATLEARGTLREGERFGFDGQLLLAVGQPSGFAAWLARDVDEAIRRLPSGGFNAKVSLTRGEQRLDDLELVLGGATFRGSASNEQPASGRGRASVTLDGGALDLDQAAAFASIFVSGDGRNRFAGRDLALNLKAGPVAVANVQAARVDAALQLRDDQIAIERLNVEGLAGANLDLRGQVAGLSTRPSGRVSGNVTSGDLLPLVDFLSSRIAQPALSRLVEQARAYPGLLADSRLALDLRSEAGDASTATLSANGTVGGTAVAANLTAGGDLTSPLDTPLDGSLSLRHQQGERVLALAGLPVLPLGLLGEANASINVKGTAREGLATEAKLSGNGFSAGFEGTAQAATSGLVLKGTGRLDADDIEPWLQTVGASLPGFGLGTPVGLGADLDLASGLLILSKISGSVDENAVGGEVNVAWKDGVPEISGALDLDALELERVAALMLGPNAFDAGDEFLPAVPFAQGPILPFSLALELSVGSLTGGALGEVEDANFSLELNKERGSVNGLTGKVAGGAAKGSAELRNNGGTALLTAQLGVAGADASLLLPEAGIAGRGDASISITSSGKTVGGLASNLSGSGTASVRDVRIAGFNPAAFPALIAAADKIGRDVSAENVSRFAPDLVGAGTFAAPRADLAFTIAGGTLRAPPVTLSGEGATLSADLRGDLNRGDLQLSGALAFLPGDEALVGSEPAVNFSRDGPLSVATLRWDTTPLAQFLTQRALEREQARVEAMQAGILEQQRLRREVRLYTALQKERERQAAEKAREAEAARLRAEERAAIDAAAREAKAEQARQAAGQKAKEEQDRQDAERRAREQRAAPPPARAQPTPVVPPLDLREFTNPL